MAVYSTNQNRQFYVVGELNPATGGKDKDGNLYFSVTGAVSKLRTDLINPSSIVAAKASAPADGEIKLKKTTLTLSNDVNSGKPISGEDYIVRVNFRQLYGFSDEDLYQKYGAVHATTAMATKTDLFWLQLADSLFVNLNNKITSLLDIALSKTTTADGKSTTSDTVITSIKKVNGDWFVNGTKVTPGTAYSGISIIEKSQVPDWRLGTAQLQRVYFQVIPTVVKDTNKEYVEWGVTTDGVSGTVVGNGYNTADLEYFCMGERGDQYRKIGWPANIDTKYLVDAASTYYYLDIQYAYQGSCEDIQKSEKTMTFVGTSKSDIAALVTYIESNSDVKVTTTAEYDK